MKRYRAKIAVESKRVYVPVPFDPDTEWGKKPRHLVGGTLNGLRFRGAVECFGADFGISLGPAWQRSSGLAPGDAVEVALDAEGPQRGDLAPDIAAALAGDPKAAAFFDGLAQFYRKNYLRWVEATQRRPELRKERIAEMIRLLKAGTKQRPRSE